MVLCKCFTAPLLQLWASPAFMLQVMKFGKIYNLYSFVYLSLRYPRKTLGSKGDPVAALIKPSPLGYRDPLRWIFALSHDLRPLKLPAAMSSSRDGRSSLAACAPRANIVISDRMEVEYDCLHEITASQ